MADQATLDAIEIGELIIQTDNTRGSADPFKLPAPLRLLEETRLAQTKGANAAASLVAGDTVGASVQVQEALEKLREALRNAFNFLKGVPNDEITKAQRAAAFTAYGWTGGKIGDLASPTRVANLADLATAAHSAVVLAAKYPPSIMNKLSNWLAVLEANEAVAGGGSRQAAIEARNAARDLLIKINSRVRFFYCGASDLLDQTPELARIGYQPRRDAGDAEPQALPAATGPATFNAATRFLSLAALPLHATSLRAFRQPAGGDAELAGVSTTTTVGVTAFAPLTPGVTYEVWVVGRNSRGDGPVSNKVTFVA